MRTPQRSRLTRLTKMLVLFDRQLSGAAAARDRDCSICVSTAHAAAKAALRGGKTTVKVVREVEVMARIDNHICRSEMEGCCISTQRYNQPGHGTKSTERLLVRLDRGGH